eukprot:5143700-Amphidinium_carterae.2
MLRAKVEICGTWNGWITRSSSAAVLIRAFFCNHHMCLRSRHPQVWSDVLFHMSENMPSTRQHDGSMIRILLQGVGWKQRGDSRSHAMGGCA